MTTVNELIEWAAQIIGEDYDERDWVNYSNSVKEMFRKIAKQILSHPDLTLIDREKSLPTMDCSDCEASEGCEPNDCVEADGYCKAQGDFKQANYEPVIPLAEAIMSEPEKK